MIASQSDQWDTLKAAMRSFMESATQQVQASPPTAMRWRIVSRESQGLSQRYEPVFDASADGLRAVVAYGGPDHQSIAELPVPGCAPA